MRPPYTVCSAGFESLCASDPNFLPFKRSLLSRASLQYDRAQTTPEQQAKVDRALTALLQHLVPFFLTPAATAVLEYLVRKYKCVSPLLCSQSCPSSASGLQCLSASCSPGPSL